MREHTDVDTAPQHGDPVESWTSHTHSVLVICPKCRQPVSRRYLSCYRFDMPHVISCSCGQGFGIKWPDETQNAQLTIHTWVDIDIPEIFEDAQP